MPISSRWWPFSDSIVEYERDEGGVYELGDSDGTVVYIGKSNKVKRRLKEHLEESGTCIKRNAKKYRVEYTKNYRKREYELYQEHIRLHGEKPLCNVVSPPEP